MRKIFNSTILSLAVFAASFGVFQGCNKYLNVVPDDGIATMESAFNLRSTAIRYLYTCYSFMTGEGNPLYDAAFMTGDEFWDVYPRISSSTSGRFSQYLFQIALGNQSASACFGSDFASMYQAIRCCDNLVDNIDQVPDMTRQEKEQWKAEATFLKAYYHFNLIRKWGPVPLVAHSLPIDSDIDQVRVYRDNIDDCFDFVLGLLDEALPKLPLVNPSSDEFGRITRAACAGLRAKVAVFAASPLFNGNEEQASLIDNRGVRLFPEKDEAAKKARWDAAVTACKQAIDICKEANLKLYDGSDIEYRMADSLKTTLTLRNAFTERWNSEVVWGNTQTTYALTHRLCLPIFSSYRDMIGGYRFLGVPLKIAEQFYTDHGLPIENDDQWAGVNPFDLKIGDDKHAYYIKKDYVTCRLNYDREPRFYAALGFDGGTWFGQLTNYNDVKPDNLHFVSCRIGGVHAKTGTETGPATGYFPKKILPYRCTWTGDNRFTDYWFPWPMIRLSDLYLLYAEAINEAEGPNGARSAELFRYLDAVRERAHIPDVKKAWDTYSNRPGYYKTQAGMRDILHRERLNELCFESQRFWDIRRWKEAPAQYQKNIYGFKMTGAAPEDYYVRTLLYEQKFGLRDYFWPIATSYIEKNPNLKQNIGW